MSAPGTLTVSGLTGAARMRWWGPLTVLAIALIILCGAWITTSAWALSAVRIRTQWLAVEGVLLGFCVLAGYIVANRPDGILIDDTNRISLSRLQWTVWFILLLGSYFTESIWNVGAGWISTAGDPFPVVQTELLALLGIATGSAVTSSLIVDSKKNATNAPPPPQNPVIGQPTQQGLIDANVSASEASWADLYLGDEVANRNIVDISRLQKLLITMLLAMVYVQMQWSTLGISLMDQKDHLLTNAHFDFMPKVGQSFVWLLGISHAGYLAYKAVPKTPSGAN